MKIEAFETQDNLFARAVLAYLDESYRPSGEAGDACDALIESETDLLDTIAGLVEGQSIEDQQSWFTCVLHAGMHTIASQEAVRYYAEKRQLSEHEYALIYQTIPSLAGLIIGLFAPFSLEELDSQKAIYNNAGRRKTPIRLAVEALTVEAKTISELRKSLRDHFNSKTLIKTSEGEIKVTACSSPDKGGAFKVSLALGEQPAKEYGYTQLKNAINRIVNS